MAITPLTRLAHGLIPMSRNRLTAAETPEPMKRTRRYGHRRDMSITLSHDREHGLTHTLRSALNEFRPDEPSLPQELYRANGKDKRPQL